VCYSIKSLGKSSNAFLRILSIRLEGPGIAGFFFFPLGVCAGSPKGEHEPDGQENPRGQCQPDEFKKKRTEDFVGGKAQLLAQPNPGTDVENIKANCAVAGCAAGRIKDQGNNEDAHDDPQNIEEGSYVGQFLCYSQLPSGPFTAAALYLLGVQVARMLS
jgi:hypothetical protein